MSLIKAFGNSMRGLGLALRSEPSQGRPIS